MRIVWVSRCFPPRSGAMAERVEALTTRFARAGHAVVVVTAATDRSPVWRRDRHGDVTVVRTAVIPAAAVAAEVRAADVVIGAASPWTWAASAWGLAEVLRVPLVVELDEPHAVPAVLRRRAALLICTSDAGARAHRIDAIAIPHAIDLGSIVASPLDTALRADLGLGEGLVVVAPSTHASAPLLVAAQELPEVRFVLVGTGASPNNVTRVPAPRPERRARLVAAADLVVLTADDPMSLVLEAMARARPVLLVGGGEAATIVDAAGAGWVVARGDTSAVVEAIREAQADPAGAWARGEVARLHVAEHFDLDRLAEAYLARLARITAR